MSNAALDIIAVTKKMTIANPVKTRRDRGSKYISEISFSAGRSRNRQIPLDIMPNEITNSSETSFKPEKCLVVSHRMMKTTIHTMVHLGNVVLFSSTREPPLLRYPTGI